MTTPLPAAKTWWFWSLALGLPAVLAASLAVAVADDPSKGHDGERRGVAALPPEPVSPDHWAVFPKAPKGEEVEPDGDLEVVESGFSMYTTPAGPAYSYAAIIENPTDARADVVRVRTLLMDAEGTILLSDERFVQTMAPGARVAVGSEAPDGLEIASIEVRMEVDAWRRPTADPATIAASEVETVETEFATLKTTARISSDAGTDLTDIELTAVYRDAGGDIIGGSPGFLDYLPSGSVAVATIQSGSVIPGVASTDVIPSSSGFPIPVGESMPAAGGGGAPVDVDG